MVITVTNLGKYLWVYFEDVKYIHLHTLEATPKHFFFSCQGVWSTPKANEKKLNATFKVRLRSIFLWNEF